MAKGSIVTALLLSSSVAAVAQGGPVPTVFGMAMGQPIDVPYCAGDVFSRDICVDKRMRGPRGPYSGAAGVHLRCAAISWGSCAFSVEVVDGRLERAFMYTQGLKDQRSAMSDLRRKFGDPTSMQLVERSGGQVIEAQWATAQVLVRFSGLMEGFDRGSLLIETSKGREAYEQRSIREAAKRPKERSF